MREFHILSVPQKTRSEQKRGWDCNGIETEADWWARDCNKPTWKDLLVPAVIVFVLALATWVPAFASDSKSGHCEQMFANGQSPKVVKPAIVNNQTERPAFFCHRLYAIEHSGSRHTAYWSAEKLDGKRMGIAAQRVDAFKPNPKLSWNESSKIEDYTHSGYDKGHLAPVGDMHGDAEAMLESFYLSNMIPQVPGNNRDGWSQFESYVREMAQARGMLYVVTGPVYLNKPILTIGVSEVAVPSHIFKVIYDPKANAVLSVMVPNKPFTLRDLPKYVVDLASMQKATGVNMLPGLSIVKSSSSMWTRMSSN